MTEASYQRQRDAGQLNDDDESFLLLMLIFVVVPLVGFSILTIFIYRRVTNNRTTYHGTTPLHTSLSLRPPRNHLLCYRLRVGGVAQW